MGDRSFRVVVYLLGAVGVLAAVGGPAYAINGATRAPGTVTVWPAFEGEETVVPRADGVPAMAPGGWPDGVQLVQVDGVLELRAWGSTITEQLLARGDVALLGLVVGAAALALVPLLRSIAAGAPFRHGSARRLAVTAGLATVYGLVGPVLASAATSMVLRRTGLAVEGTFEASASFSFAPFVIATSLLVLAEAFRRGEQLAADVEGLV